MRWQCKIPNTMAHIKIKTDYGEFVHASRKMNNYTLCGIETDGDETIGIAKGVVTNEKINCPDCIEIITYCKSIKNSALAK